MLGVRCTGSASCSENMRLQPLFAGCVKKKLRRSSRRKAHCTIHRIGSSNSRSTCSIAFVPRSRSSLLHQTFCRTVTTLRWFSSSLTWTSRDAAKSGLRIFLPEFVNTWHESFSAGLACLYLLYRKLGCIWSKFSSELVVPAFC